MWSGGNVGYDSYVSFNSYGSPYTNLSDDVVWVVIPNGGVYNSGSVLNSYGSPDTYDSNLACYVTSSGLVDDYRYVGDGVDNSYG